jgi:hypothetical protein
MKTAKLLLEVEYDPAFTTPDELAGALDTLMDKALGECGTLDSLGEIEVGEFFPLEEDPRKQ